MGKGKFGRESARGARGGGKSMEITESTYFTAVHSSAGPFRISYEMGCIICIIIKYFFANYRKHSDFTAAHHRSPKLFRKKCVVAHNS